MAEAVTVSYRQRVYSCPIACLFFSAQLQPHRWWCVCVYVGGCAYVQLLFQPVPYPAVKTDFKIHIRSHSSFAQYPFVAHQCLQNKDQMPSPWIFPVLGITTLVDNETKLVGYNQHLRKRREE